MASLMARFMLCGAQFSSAFFLGPALPTVKQNVNLTTSKEPGVYEQRGGSDSYCVPPALKDTVIDVNNRDGGLPGIYKMPVQLELCKADCDLHSLCIGISWSANARACIILFRNSAEYAAAYHFYVSGTHQYAGPWPTTRTGTVCGSEELYPSLPGSRSASGFECWANVARTSPDPTECTSPSSPTASPKAIGDPHMSNMLGQRFDLARAGLHILVRIPQQAASEDVLVEIAAGVKFMSASCEDLYIQQLNVTGKWVKQSGIGKLTYSARRGNFSKAWTKVGKIMIKVVHGETKNAIKYLNVFTRHLGSSGLPVGGLLGQGDHTAASTPTGECRSRVISL